MKNGKSLKIPTQNLRRVPLFAVVVVTFFAEIPFLPECVFPEKIHNPFGRDVVFPRKLREWLKLSVQQRRSLLTRLGVQSLQTTVPKQSPQQSQSPLVGVGPQEIAKYSATTAGQVAVPTVAKAVGVIEAQLPEIAKCRATTVLERTGFNSVLLSMTLVPIPGGCAKTIFRG